MNVRVFIKKTTTKCTGIRNIKTAIKCRYGGRSLKIAFLPKAAAYFFAKIQQEKNMLKFCGVNSIEIDHHICIAIKAPIRKSWNPHRGIGQEMKGKTRDCFPPFLFYRWYTNWNLKVLSCFINPEKNETQNYCNGHISGVAHHDDIANRIHGQCHHHI